MAAVFIDELGVGFLDMRGVGEHGAAKVDGRGSGVDRPTESVAHQGWEIAGMVHVRVRENHGSDGRDGKGKMAVAIEGFLPVSLIEATIKEEVLAARFYVVHGAGHSSGGAPKCYLHSYSIYDDATLSFYTAACAGFRAEEAGYARIAQGA